MVEYKSVAGPVPPGVLLNIKLSNEEMRTCFEPLADIARQICVANSPEMGHRNFESEQRWHH
jgi:hypothetical protein